MSLLLILLPITFCITSPPWLIIAFVRYFLHSTLTAFSVIAMNTFSIIFSGSSPVSYILFVSSVTFLIPNSPAASIISSTTPSPTSVLSFSFGYLYGEFHFLIFLSPFIYRPKEKVIVERYRKESREYPVAFSFGILLQ